MRNESVLTISDLHLGYVELGVTFEKAREPLAADWPIFKHYLPLRRHAELSLQTPQPCFFLEEQTYEQAA